jgi:integrase
VRAVRRRAADGSITFDFYHRATGQLLGRSRDGMTLEQAVAIRVEIDTAIKTEPTAGSFDELATLYLASPAFKRRRPGTKEGYLRHIKLLRELWGDLPAHSVTRTAIRALHARFEDQPWRANAVMRTVRLLYNYAIRELRMPRVTSNPADHPEMYDTPPRAQVWSQGQIDAFIDAAGDNWRMRLAIALLLYTVQRPNDVLDMTWPQTWSDQDGRLWITLRQAKTGAAIDVPCHQALAREIVAARSAVAAEPRRAGQVETLLILASPTGLRWSYRNFARSWDRIRRRANWRVARAGIRARGGLPPVTQPGQRAVAKTAIRAELLSDVQRRDLRRTGMVQMALAGATVPQIASVSGHSVDRVQTILDTYLPRRGDVALGAVERWEQAGTNARIVTLAPARRPVTKSVT